MAESPEEVRARILSEELAKGSDPRVAEARSKAAEARARHGYPIDPQEAWKVKLEKETGQAPTAAAPSAAAPSAAAAAPPGASDASAHPAAGAAEGPPAASDAGAHPAQPVGSQPRLPDESASEEPSSDAATAPAGAIAPVAAAVAVEPVFEPEFGEVLYSDREPAVVVMPGGITARDGPVPVWIMVALLTVALWSVVYLIGSGADVDRNATGCLLHADRSFECFLPPESEESKAPSGGGH